MTILSLLLLLLVIGVVIYGVKLAFAGAWKLLLILVIWVIVAIIVLGVFGISLPTIPRVS